MKLYLNLLIKLSIVHLYLFLNICTRSGPWGQWLWTLEMITLALCSIIYGCSTIFRIEALAAEESANFKVTINLGA